MRRRRSRSGAEGEPGQLLRFTPNDVIHLGGELLGGFDGVVWGSWWLVGEKGSSGRRVGPAATVGQLRAVSSVRILVVACGSLRIQLK